MLNTLTAVSPLSDQKFSLKEGYVVLLLRNIQPGTCHVNGARYILEGINDSLLHLCTATGIHTRKRLDLPPIPCGPGDNNFSIPGFKRTQLISSPHLL